MRPHPLVEIAFSFRGVTGGCWMDGLTYILTCLNKDTTINEKIIIKLPGVIYTFVK